MIGPSARDGFDPALVEFDANGVPEELRFLRQFVAWRPQLRNGKWTKVPLAPARVNDHASWLTLDQAGAKALAEGGGIGFVLGGGIVGIDFDDAISLEGELHPVVVETVRGLASYAEFSVSRTGVHILVRGTIQQARNLRATDELPAREIYGHGRFLTVTGRRLAIAPATIAGGPETQLALDRIVSEYFAERLPLIAAKVPDLSTGTLSDDAIVELLFTTGPKGRAWRALFDGDVGRYDSHSNADYALVHRIRYFTRDSAQIDRIFRRSGLMRSKWDEARGSTTYGAQTVSKALAAGGPIYERQIADENARRAARERTKFASGMPLWWHIRLHGIGELGLRIIWTIACYANEKGEAWPSIATIAAHCRVSEGRVKEVMTILSQAGVLSKTRKPGIPSTVYLLIREAPGVLESSTPYAQMRKAKRSIEGIGSPPITGIGTQYPKTTKKATSNYTGGDGERAPFKIVTPPTAIRKAESK